MDRDICHLKNGGVRILTSENNWYKILKNQITDSKQGVLTSDAPLPKKKNKRRECKKQLIEWLMKASEIESKYNLTNSVIIKNGKEFDLIPESTACRILDWFEKELKIIPANGGRSVSNLIDGYTCKVSVPVILYYTNSSGVTGEMFSISVEILKNWESILVLDIIAFDYIFDTYGQGDSFAEWGRNNLDFTK